MPGLATNGLTVITPATFTALGAGSSESAFDTYAPNGASPQTVAFPQSAGSQGSWTSVVAAGTTQLGATLITAFKNLITVATTASTHGVRLPIAVTGMEILIGNGATFGAKVWPYLGAQIGAAATNAVGPVLAINKATRFLAVSSTKWIALTGA